MKARPVISQDGLSPGPGWGLVRKSSYPRFGGSPIEETHREALGSGVNVARTVCCWVTELVWRDAKQVANPSECDEAGRASRLS